METPQWLIDGFEKAGYMQLPMNFCHFFFTKSEYSIEVFKLDIEGADWYRAYATVDGDTMVSIQSSFFKATEPERIQKYIEKIEPRLEQLLACL